MSFKTGDRVRIADREMTLADVKSGMFYDYFRNLAGTVEKIYEDHTVCVCVDQDSLPDNVRKRHINVQDAIRRRWMDGLGSEQRERLTEAQKSVVLSYNILVNSSDLLKDGKGKPPTKTKPDFKRSQEKPAALEKASQQPAARPSEADIAKAEEEYLKSIASRQSDSA
ncbi:MAG: hypothetical protein HYX78_15060 [Armatimonadetes bacterium]|nr:hypothetical protein [Armatimonadota bacterium]